MCFLARLLAVAYPTVTQAPLDLYATLQPKSSSDRINTSPHAPPQPAPQTPSVDSHSCYRAKSLMWPEQQSTI